MNLTRIRQAYPHTYDYDGYILFSNNGNGFMYESDADPDPEDVVLCRDFSFDKAICQTCGITKRQTDFELVEIDHNSVDSVGILILKSHQTLVPSALDLSGF